MKKILLGVILLLTLGNLYSHPHIFINYKLEILESKANITWEFDPLESQKSIYFYDNNNNGVIDGDEVEVLFNERFSRLQERNYFLTIRHGESNYLINEIYNFNASINNNGNLEYSFSFNIPSPVEKNLVITPFDTSYFVAFEDPEPENIKIGEDLFLGILTNHETPYYYDPLADVTVELDTSKPRPGWQVVYPTEILISTQKIVNTTKLSLRDVKPFITNLQREIYLKLSGILIDLTYNFNYRIIILALLALIYGIIHALGPGHRKIVITSYLVSKEDAKPLEGIMISSLSALLHSLSGIIIVLFSYMVFNVLLQDTSGTEKFINMISAISLTVLSGIMIYKKIKKKGCTCSKVNKEELIFILLSSLIPCPGSITIMVVAVSLGAVHIGILSVLFMSLGIGITISVISVLALKGKTLILHGSNPVILYIKNIIEWGAIGLLLVLALGLFSF